MTYNFDFFDTHMHHCRTLKRWNLAATIEGHLISFFKDSDVARRSYKVVFKSSQILDFSTEDVVVVAGAYSKGGHSAERLESILKRRLPDDFRQFYATFGECLIFTRGMPVLIESLDHMIDWYRQNSGGAIGCRFFRFASFDGADAFLGLRLDDQTGEWQVILCSSGFLYSEIVGLEGRQLVVAQSFFEWIRHLIETNGYPDECSPRDSRTGYSTMVMSEDGSGSGRVGHALEM